MSIDRFAFCDCPKLKALLIPDSATEVNGRPFERSGIKTQVLNALGFLLFDPDWEYTLAGPDEDGYGRETCYGRWYLDGNLCPVPGAECLHGYSNIDRRIREVKERFQKCHDTAAKAGRVR